MEYSKKKRKFGNKFFKFSSFYLSKSDANMFGNAISGEYCYRIVPAKISGKKLYGVWTRKK